jgi:hypothetical protein
MWPVTIIATRYGGVYEGSQFDDLGQAVEVIGKWAAFNCFPDEISADAFGSDLVAAPWWAQFRTAESVPHPTNPEGRLYVGFGMTPDDALTALENAMAEDGP